MSKLAMTARIGSDGLAFIVKGRVAWALGELIKAGPKGCTPIDNPAPRWSGYVHRLRRDCALAIETVDENHGGPFAGRHARYVLRSPVVILDAEGDA